MKITIDYESSWRNSFLDGSNNEQLPKDGRKFVASMKELKTAGNYIGREVTIETVLGVLNRLIGDQRKLYQSIDGAGGHPHYFEDIKPGIKFVDNQHVVNQETVFIRNMNRSTDQNSYTGMVKVNDPVFKSDYSPIFWGVLAFELDDLLDFIIEDREVDAAIDLDPISIMGRLEELKKLKPIEASGQVQAASEKLQNMPGFGNYKPLNAKGQQLVLPLYCSGLYLQLGRLAEKGYDMESAKSKKGGISGISNNGFTPKDFMNKYTTGDKKIIYGNPYIREEFVKGVGKVKNTLKKVSGQLEITLDIERGKGEEIQHMIDAAGVSSFYLGKKGLAYVSEIRI